MSKQIVSVVDGRVQIHTHSDQEFNSSEATVSKQHYAKEVEVFQKMLLELQKMQDDEAYRKAHAAEFLHTNGVWLHNLAETGFAINYTQYVRDN